MVLSDLLGPVSGPEEEIAEPSVRDRYLVGMLAPKRQDLSPEEFDELPNGGSGSVEDGASEPSSPATKTMFPSSFGMTFCVGLDVNAPPSDGALGPLPPGSQPDPHARQRRQEAGLEANPACGRFRADPSQAGQSSLGSRRRVPRHSRPGPCPQAGSLLECHAVPGQRATKSPRSSETPPGCSSRN